MRSITNAIDRKLGLSIRFIPILCVGLIASACTAQQDGASAASGTSRDGDDATRAARNVHLNDDISTSRKTAITRAVEIASPAVVGINVTEIRNYTDPFNDM